MLVTHISSAVYFEQCWAELGPIIYLLSIIHHLVERLVLSSRHSLHLPNILYLGPLTNILISLTRIYSYLSFDTSYYAGSEQLNHLIHSSRVLAVIIF